MSLVRLQKFLSTAGVCSRRSGEKLIRAGRVQVNGRVVDELGAKVEAEQDRVAVDGIWNGGWFTSPCTSPGAM
jgi:23S rRNA pseudouridine2605 synthase